MVYELGRKVLMLVADKRQLDRRVLHEAVTLAKHDFRVNIVSLYPDVCQPTNLPPNVVITELSNESRGGNKKQLEELLKKNIPRTIQEHIYFGLLDPANKLAERFKSLINDDWDILIAHDLPVLPLAFMLHQKQGRGRVVFDAHEIYDEQHDALITKTARNYWRAIEDLYVPQCDGVLTVSSGLAEELRERHSLTAPPTVLLNAFPYVEAFKAKNALYELYDISPKRKIVLCQGGILPNRSLEEFICAWEFLPLPRPALVFLGFGVKGYMQELELLITGLDLQHDVFFGKAVVPDEILEYTCCAALGLISNRGEGKNNTDGSPNRLFEYIQARVPVLSYEHNGVRNIIAQTNTGWVVNWESPEHLAKIIQAMLPEAEAICEEKLAQAAEKFSWENEEPKLLSLINTLT